MFSDRRNDVIFRDILPMFNDMTAPLQVVANILMCADTDSVQILQKSGCFG